MYDFDNPTFTYAGALRPRRDMAKTIRTAALLACAMLLVAANIL